MTGPEGASISALQISPSQSCNHMNHQSFSSQTSASDDDTESTSIEPTMRPRSDTMLTTSSSSSFPNLQTPQSPSILGVLDQASPSGNANGKWADIRRRESYGFSFLDNHDDRLGTTPRVSLHSRRFSDLSMVFSLDDSSNDLEQIEKSIIPTSPLPFTLGLPSEPQIHVKASTDLPPDQHHHESRDHSLSDDPTPNGGVSMTNEENRLVQSRLLVGLSEDNDFEERGSRATEAISVETSTKKGFKANMRHKLSRSKSSFKGVFKSPTIESNGDSVELNNEMGDDAENMTGEKRRRPRLRSLLSLSSRSQSTASIRSSVSRVPTHTSENVDNGSTPAVHGNVAINPSLSTLDPTIRSRDFAVIPSLIDDDVNSGVVSIRKMDKGKARATSRDRFGLTDAYSGVSKPVPLSTQTTTSGLPSITLPLTSRSHSSPLIRSDVKPEIKTTGVFKPKVNLFDTMLPRELKIVILKTLVKTWADQPRIDRWSGEVGGRRELIKLSRVSRSWQDLCFDGQLWPMMHLAPFASHLPPRTLRRILLQTYPFIKSLSLQGMTSLMGYEFVLALFGMGSIDIVMANPNPGVTHLPMLVELDLRGCKQLLSADLVELVNRAPALKRVNFKGLQAVSSEVLRSLARTSTNLEYLDVSRCWDVSLCDICVFIRMLDDEKSSKLRILRIAGMKAYAHTASDFLPLVAEKLVNLETLDVLGCTHIFDADFERFAQVHRRLDTTSPIKHLILSSCVTLTAEFFSHIVGKFPNLIKLELAGLPNLFAEDLRDNSNDKGFLKFLKTLYKLERLDLEGTGVRGGVTDQMLEVLTPPRIRVANEDYVASELKELRIGYARAVTPEGLAKFIRGCPKLRILEADNTAATNSNMREFIRRHPTNASLSLIDCRSVTPTAYSHLASNTRPREGWTDYASIPMGYEAIELPSTKINHDGKRNNDQIQEEEIGKSVLKTFWSWRRVGVGKPWREALEDSERIRNETPNWVSGSKYGEDGLRRPRLGRGSMSSSGGIGGRRRSWWKGDGDERDEFDDRAGCVVM